MRWCLARVVCGLGILLIAAPALAAPGDASGHEGPLPSTEKRDAPTLADQGSQPAASLVPTARPKGLLGRGESATGWSRAEFVAGQFLHGGGYGLMLCGAFGCTTDATTLDFLLFGTVGGTLAFLLTPDGISTGPALAINSGFFWGLANGGLLLGSQRAFSQLVIVATLGTFDIAGTAAGILVAREWRPTAGQVSMANSGAFWAAVVGAGVGLGLYGRAIPSQALLTELVVTDAGLVGLGLLSTVVQVSRGRMLLIDVGGLLGTLFGAALSIVIKQGVDLSALGWCGAGGALAGLGLATWWTRDQVVPNAPAVTLAPMVGGGRAGAMLAMSF